MTDNNVNNEPDLKDDSLDVIEPLEIEETADEEIEIVDVGDVPPKEVDLNLGDEPFEIGMDTVEKIFKDQGLKINSVDDMWKKLANGEFTADADTIAQAKEDISDNGYWGVSQTSDRIYDFAMALSGGDEEKMQKMKEAVEKGFKEATKSWGKDLPDISSRTYDAVMKKFDDFFNKNTTASDSDAE